MTIDATFWVTVSFFIFIGGLIYLKVPKKINSSLNAQINQMKKEIENAEKLKVESKNLLSDYENKIDKSKNQTKELISLAKQNSEKNILEKTKKFHQMMEDRKKNAEQKIIQMKENALNDIKKASIRVSMEAVENLIKNSIDKNKIEKINLESLQQAKAVLKNTKI